MNLQTTIKRSLGLDNPVVIAAGALAAVVTMSIGAGGYVVAYRDGHHVTAYAILLTAIASCGGYLALWIAFRRHTMAMSGIKDALESAAAGETDPEAVMVAERFGAHALAWNRMLDELLILRRERFIGLAVQQGAVVSSQQDSLRGACDAVWHGMLVTDSEFSVTYANGAAAVFLGRTRESLMGSQLADLITDPAVHDGLGLMKTEKRSRFVVESQLVSGREEAVFRLSTRSYSDRNAFVVLIEDISQQRASDRARNAFVAQATHELRTPLTNIRLFVEALIETPNLPAAEQAEHINRIAGESRRLERLVGDMLSVSDMEAGTLRITRDDLRSEELLRQIESDYQYSATTKKIALEFHLPPKLPVLHADQDLIVLAISNLLGNAIKYTPSGGKVDVTAYARDNTLFIEVADTGLGIAPEEAELVFERFYRAKDSRIEGITGSGLGLPLARQIVRMHGGNLSLSSEINKGSTFTVSIPITTSVTLAA